MKEKYTLFDNHMIVKITSVKTTLVKIALVKDTCKQFAVKFFDHGIYILLREFPMEEQVDPMSFLR